jgi:hypothetical protein
MTDPVNLLYPDRAFAAEELRAGRLPLWNHHILCGVVHAANPLTASFYPPNLLAAFIDPLDFLLWSAAFHVVLAGVLFQAWMLAAGARPRAAALGGLAFALSGWVSAHLHNTQLVAAAAWIPFGFAGVEWILNGRPKRGALALALSLAFQWLAGFSLFAVFGCLALAIYAVVSLALLRGRTLHERGFFAARIMAAAAIGLVLASIQVLPTLDARSRAMRTGSKRAELLQGQTFSPGVLTGLALPRWLGDAHDKPVTEDPEPDPAHPDQPARRDAALLVLGHTPEGKVPPINAFGERTIYAGGPVILLALAGLGALRRRAALVVLVPATLAAVFAFGLLPPDAVLERLGLNVGAPGRGLLILVLAVPALAAFGLDRLFDDTRAPVAWTLVRIGGVVLGLGGLAASVAALSAPGRSLETVLSLLKSAGAGAALGANPDVPLSTWVTHLAPAFERLARDLLLFSAFVLASWMILERARRVALAAGDRADGLRIAALPLLALVAIDLGAFFLQTIRPVVRDHVYESSPALDFLKAQSSRGRFARVSPDRAAAVPGDMDSLLPPNMGMTHDLLDVQGYRELIPVRLLRLVDGISARTVPVGFAGFALADAGSRILDLLSARWLIAARPLDESSAAFAASGLKRVDVGASDPAPSSRPSRDVVVYENPDAQPFAWIVRDAAVAGDDETIASLRSGASDFRTRVLLERQVPGAVPQAPEPGAGEHVTARLGPDSIQLDVTLASPAFIVLSECWDPGWRATLWHGPWKQDRGNELEVLRANGAFMAVFAPKGSETIELHYWPPSLTLGIALAAAAALALLVWTAWPASRAQVPPRA